jgi:hypothetical protein
MTLAEQLKQIKELADKATPGLEQRIQQLADGYAGDFHPENLQRFAVVQELRKLVYDSSSRELVPRLIKAFDRLRFQRQQESRKYVDERFPNVEFEVRMSWLMELGLDLDEPILKILRGEE